MKKLLTIYFTTVITLVFGQLAPKQTLAPLLESRIRPIDINGDGHQDIVGKTFDKGQLAWIENEGGTGNFQNLRLISEIEDIDSYIITDIEGDGDYDIVCVTQDEHIVYFRNIDGLGSFSDLNAVDDNIFNPCGMSIAAADIDDDGLTDILLSENCSIGLGWYKNLGNGFSAFNSIQEGIGIQVMYPADYDLDGDIDIIGQRNGDLRYLEHIDGNGAFTEGVVFESDLGNVRSFEINDINNDGYPDLLYSFASSHKVAWQQNDGDGTFGSPQILINGNQPHYASAGDVDGDGDMDVVASLYLDNLLVWFENMDGQGNFSDPIEISSGTQAIEYYGLYVADLDNDGDSDLLLRSFYDDLICWIKNLDGAGTFGNIIPLSANGTEADIGIAELDNTPGKDLVYTNDYGLIFLKNLDGNHHYSTMNVLLPRASFTKLADLNGDGFMDIIARDTIQNPNNPAAIIGYKMIWLQNNDLGDFTELKIITLDEYSFQAIGDIDQDGDLDIIAKGPFISGYFYLFENVDGLGNFGAPQELFSVSYPIAIYFKDMNGDSYPDLIYNRGSPTELVWHENLLTNSFDETPNFITQEDGYEDNFIVLDFDFDEDMDVAYMNSNDDFIWFENDGLGNFGAEHLIVADGWQPGVFTFHDVDSDNDMDLVYHVSGYTKFIWHLQEYSGVFGEAVEWDGVGNVNSFHFVDVEEDGDVDLFTNSGTSPVFFENYSNNPVIKGSIFWDENENGFKDSTELGLYQQTTKLSPDAIVSFTTSDGKFLFPVDPGVHNLICIPSNGWGFSTDSIVTINVLEGNDTIVQNFGLIVVDSTVQIAGDLTSAPTRCGFTVPFWLSYENQGATFMDGKIHLKFDSLLFDSIVIFQEVEPIPDSIVGLHAYWSFEDLHPTHYDQVIFSIEMPGPDFIGEMIHIIGDVAVINDDMDTLFTDIFDFESEINCSYDPNDKLVEPSFINFDNYTLFNDTLYYTIRFQNTGTDTAFTVRIEDILDNSLDLSTFRIVSASHTHETTLKESGEVSFTFNNILLPPQNQNEVQSHGFVKFSIQSNEDITQYTVIYNTADIFFDFNPPILTNTVTNILVEEYPIIFETTSPLCHDSEEGSISVLFPPVSFDFLWPDGSRNSYIDSLLQGDYLLEIYNRWGHIVADSVINITAPEQLTSSQINTTPATLNNQDGTATTQAFGGTPPYQYNWGSTPPQSTQTAINFGAGNYQLTITDANNCIYIQTFTIEVITSTNEQSENWIFNVSPNPSNGNCLIEFQLSKISNWDLKLINSLGQEIQHFSAPDQGTRAEKIQFHALETGIYFIHLYTGERMAVKKLLVIEN